MRSAWSGCLLCPQGCDRDPRLDPPRLRNPGRRSARAQTSDPRRVASLLVVLFVLGVVVVIVEVVVVIIALFFVLVELIVVEVVLVVVVRHFELVGAQQNEALPTLRTAQRVPLVVVLGVDLIEFTFGTGRHASAPRSGIGRAR